MKYIVALLIAITSLMPVTVLADTGAGAGVKVDATIVENEGNVEVDATVIKPSYSGWSGGSYSTPTITPVVISTPSPTPEPYIYEPISYYPPLEISEPYNPEPYIPSETIPSKTINWYLIGAMLGIIILVILGIYYFRGRKQTV